MDSSGNTPRAGTWCGRAKPSEASAAEGAGAARWGVGESADESRGAEERSEGIRRKWGNAQRELNRPAANGREPDKQD
jgi:hypothetical protein